MMSHVIITVLNSITAYCMFSMIKMYILNMFMFWRFLSLSKHIMINMLYRYNMQYMPEVGWLGTGYNGHFVAFRQTCCCYSAQIVSVHAVE